jgi:ferredoxin
MFIARDLRHFVELDKDDIKVESFDNASRQVPGMKDGDPTKTFDDLRLPFTEEQVKAEANRCLGCGATKVDENACIGCGLCTTKCEFDAIHLHRDLPDASNMMRAEDKLKAVLPYAAKRKIAIIKNKNK